jgi:7,8-dihydropterin-6-yl-methyl-4-(beta-D-ribofuranosyl)aminobenzene 5'-phosphate synthase
VDTVVLSHGHWDHGNGLLYLKKKNLITHPAAFIRRFRKTDMTPVGLSLSRSHVAEKFRLVEITEPYEISSQIYYLGAIPRLNDFEAQTTPFTDEHGKDDFVPDDSALAVIQNNELIVISGCAHAGICNIIAHAKKITGISVVSAVIGGFHLKYNNLQTQKTVQYFKDQKISKVLPSHCTELPALAAFHEAFKTEQVKTGMVFSF